MDVSSIMSPDPLRVALDTPLDAARKLMDDEDIRHLPVVDDDRLVGVVSDRDLYPNEDELAPTPGAVPMRTVADVLHVDLTTVTPEDTVVTAALEFVMQKIGCLPVVRGDGQLVGILSELDMLQAFTRSWKAGRVPEDVDHPPVSELMTSCPLAATRTTTVADAIDMCRELGARHLPVVDGEALAGIVSDRDLRRCATAGRAGETVLGEIMEREPLTVAPTTPSPAAAALMATAKVGALPVVDQDQLVGILTITDLLDHCMNSLRDPDGSTA